MTLEQIQSMWKEDSVIDQIDLDKPIITDTISTCKIPRTPKRKETIS